MRRITLLLSLGVSALVAATSQETFNAVIKKYSGLASFSASFEQQICSKSTGTCQMLSGSFLYASPNKFRLDVAVPTEELVASNGQTLWIYIPSANQAIKSKPGLTDDLFLFVGRLGNYQERYTVSLTPLDSLLEARFTAKTATRGLLPSDFTLLINPAREDIAGLSIEEGDTEVKLFLSQIKRNVDAPASKFNFTPPEGTTVVTDAELGFQ